MREYTFPYDGTNIQNKNDFLPLFIKKLTISGESIGENSVYHYLTTTTLRAGRSPTRTRYTPLGRLLFAT